MIEVLTTPGLATVQDLGRFGSLRHGVGTAGAMDRMALAAANLLLGNDEADAAIEVPLFPFAVRFETGSSFAWTGAAVVLDSRDGRCCPGRSARHARVRSWCCRRVVRQAAGAISRCPAGSMCRRCWGRAARSFVAGSAAGAGGRCRPATGSPVAAHVPTWPASACSRRLRRCRMPISDYSTALVTGASSGIGAAVVERLCREGLQVHALARRADALAALAARTGCIAHALDVTDGAGIADLAGEVAFDILVNNAGVDRPGSLLKAQAADVDLLVDVNLRAVLHLARLIVPGMAERNRGHVVNIGSIAGEYHFGGNATYHATKAAVHMLSRQLRVDLIGKMVRVTEICPGRVGTDIFAHVHGDSPETRARFIDGFLLPQASDIADAIAFALAAPLAVNVGHIEIMPTLQVPGGLTTLRADQAG